jgi:excisionase family DNA binding protein
VDAPYFSIREVARLLQISPMTVYRMISRGQLVAIRFSLKCTRVERSELKRYIKSVAATSPVIGDGSANGHRS